MKLALRNLARNRWRTGLTIAGIASAVAVVIWMNHLMGSMIDVMAKSVTQAELGDAQIHSAEYVKEPSLYYALDLATVELDAVRAIDGVEAAAPRIQAYGLIGQEKRSQVARIIGVDPEHEAKVSKVAAGVESGRWLSVAPPAPPAPREVVLGLKLAKQLEAEVGAELVVFLQAANGALGNDLLKVVGLARSGHAGLDRAGVWMHLADAQWLTALDGRAHEVALALSRDHDPEATTAALGRVIGEDNRARTWAEIMPEMAQLLEMSRTQMWILYVIIFLIAGLGILNAQRMTALERRREFGVLLAIGTTPPRLARQVLAESTVICFIGGLVGAALGAALTLYHQHFGFDFRAFGSDPTQDFTYMGANLGVVHFHLVWADVVLPMLIVVGVGLLAGIWPAITSARLDMTQAIAGRTG